jgi:hypothetical protein
MQRGELGYKRFDTRPAGEHLRNMQQKALYELQTNEKLSSAPTVGIRRSRPPTAKSGQWGSGEADSYCQKQFLYNSGMY